ncbi:hypothetical protein IWX63_003343 [Arthrobacter sp. CAN_A2]
MRCSINLLHSGLDPDGLSTPVDSATFERRSTLAQGKQCGVHCPGGYQLTADRYALDRTVARGQSITCSRLHLPALRVDLCRMRSADRFPESPPQRPPSLLRSSTSSGALRRFGKNCGHVSGTTNRRHWSRHLCRRGISFSVTASHAALRQRPAPLRQRWQASRPAPIKDGIFPRPIHPEERIANCSKISRITAAAKSGQGSLLAVYSVATSKAPSLDVAH